MLLRSIEKPKPKPKPKTRKMIKKRKIERSKTRKTEKGVLR